MMQERLRGAERTAFAGTFYPPRADRSAWESVPADARERFTALAEKNFGTTAGWPMLPATLFMEYKRTGDRARYESALFARRGAREALGFGECLSAGGRYVDDIINGVYALCEETFWGLPAHNYAADPLFDPSRPYVDLYAAETGALLAVTMYLVGDKIRAVSPVLYKRVYRELNRRIVRPFVTRTDHWWMGYDRPPNNWAPWIVSNVLLTLLYGRPSAADFAAGMEKGGLILDRFMAGYGDDGGCDEGAGYWNEAACALFDCLEILFVRSSGRVDVFGNAKIRNMAEYICRAHICGDRYFNFADCSAKPDVDYAAAFRFARRVGSDRMAVFAARGYAAQPVRTGLRPFRRELPALFDTEIAAWAQRAETYETGFYFSNLQVATARQSADPADGFYLAAKGGHNDEYHNHNDVGAFIVYFGGSPLLVDAGVETYRRETFGPERYSIWTMRSDWHNVPTVNGVLQKHGRMYAARDVRYADDGVCLRFSLDMAGAYPAEAGLQSLVRQFVFDRAAGTIAVADAFAMQKTGTVSYRFLTAERPEIKPDGVILFSGGRPVGFAYPAALTAACERVPLSDPRLVKAWGDSLYALTFSGAAGERTELVFTLSAV